MKPLFAVLAVLVALPALAQTPESPREFKRVVKLLSDLNARSVDESREYCGALGRDEGGFEVHLAPHRGEGASCGSAAAPRAWDQVIDYHTHGSFDEGYMNEVPSDDDVLYTLERGNPHYVATPGGRLWRIDPANGISVLVCGPRCLPFDPRYDERAHRPVREAYTLRELEQRIFRR
ncbi:uncharacterized protein DUF4329 [Hasllibacter halocynthiae]|uniref:Uncharacterized protein DUF4329 n=1 Tax=Hasllibacter halocynthiae TaxID=595589 RepID=A0A2T0X266_9RHOB|nr:DUF4329 domain-containing protein [Hasllibacter halocynthiae]PRY93049.1 uncharacterized protein DUF4329 [Hasllibacter halocynthiae]